LAVVAASAVAGITGTDDVASFVALTTLASGALLLVLAGLRMEWIAQFRPRAVDTPRLGTSNVPDRVAGRRKRAIGRGSNRDMSRHASIAR
jgi:hypothetical protein